MKLCMSHYGHENIPDAKLSPVTLLVFEIYVTEFPSEKGSKSSNSAIPPRKMGLAFKKIVFMSRIIFLDPKLTPPMSISAISKWRKFFHFVTLGTLDEKRAAAAPQIDQFC